MINYRHLDYLALIESSKKILRFTCQFYMFKEGTTELPVHHGCGILLEHNQNYYCLSNAHVLADRFLATTFVLLGGGRTMTMGGQYYFTELPPAGRNADKLDITIVHLTPDTIESLRIRGYDFLSTAQVLTGYQPKENDFIMVAGYPGNQTKIDNKNKKVISKPFLFKTKVYHKGLAEIGYQNEFHVIANYQRNTIIDSQTGIKKVGPKPHGVSGSGAWLMKKDHNGNYIPQLIGIFTEYLENRALLVSTKIDLFIDLIKIKLDPSIVNKGIQVHIINE